jgi:predicted enzyme related to lactoylglutathione lyase
VAGHLGVSPVDVIGPRGHPGCVRDGGVIRKVDAVTVPVPDLDAGLDFYGRVLGHRLAWRNDAVGQAGLQVADADSELVLTTRQSYEPNWLVDDVDACVEVFLDHGGELVQAPFDLPVGRAAVVRDPFGNTLVLVDLSKGRYTTGPDGDVTGVLKPAPEPATRPPEQ